jgi:hypothetical protein
MNSKDKRQSLDYLLQRDIFDELIPSTGKQLWQPLYISTRVRPDTFGLYCALLTHEAAFNALKHDSWDFHVGDGRPGFSQGSDGKEQVTIYHRFGGSGGVRPLVCYRDFYGAFPTYLELCEEFRHYHNLAEDHGRGLLLDFDRSGYEIEVARVKPALIEGRTKYLREFQAGTGFFLAIYIDSVRYSQLELSAVTKGERTVVHSAEGLRYRRDIVKCDHIEEFATFSRLLSKVILPPPPMQEAGVWPFEDRDEEKEVSFVTSVDESGKPVEHTSDPDKLRTYFGANPNAPHYLTPVYFRREVLTKYYADPDRYTVSDGHLSCLSLWGVRIDNDHPSHVVVFLGDLGRDLPYEERLHWKQFNVAPEGGISATNYKRSFLAEFADPESADLAFQHEYVRFADDWSKQQGWDLFLPLDRADEHLLDTLHVPVTNSQAELDAQVLTLTKLLIDSLNEAEIEARAGPGEKGEKGITKFDRFLKKNGFEQADGVIHFLRVLQSLRSAGSGHRKGSRYSQILADLGVDIRRKPDIMTRLLSEGRAMLRALNDHFGSSPAVDQRST